jgi:hypothetical protein
VCPCQLLHQPLPAVLALVYGDEAGHTTDYTGKVGIHIALPRLVDDVKHLDVALTAILLVQFVCRFDAVDFPGCPDAETEFTAADGTVTSATMVTVTDMFMVSIYIMLLLTTVAVVFNMSGIMKRKK